jgi:3-hydroxybutyryl-CoA dehydrogenase
MGAGIAQLGCAAGMRTLLHDTFPDALEAGAGRVHAGLAKWVEKGRVDEQASSLLRVGESLEDLAPCELLIEAAPERIELKRELFAKLSELCGEDAVLATNTSSITVTAIASAAARPENVVGMHFFNPPPLMRLLEVIKADQTGERALSIARDTGEAMGKRVIVAADGPGFLVNRCGRPSIRKRCACFRSGSPAMSRSTASAAWVAASRWGPSSSWTWSASMSASRSRSRSWSSPS